MLDPRVTSNAINTFVTTYMYILSLLGKNAFPEDLTAFCSSRTQIRKFAEEAKKLGVQYVGLCCGNASHCLRIVAEVYGRNPPASKYSPDMSQHFIWGDKEHVDDYHLTTRQQYFEKLETEK